MFAVLSLIWCDMTGREEKEEEWEKVKYANEHTTAEKNVFSPGVKGGMIGLMSTVFKEFLALKVKL